MPRHHATRARGARPRRRIALVESLEGRALLSTLGLDSATIRPDGRIVELIFSGPLDDPVGLPDWSSAAAAGNQLTTSTGVALEPLGTVVTTADDATLTWTSTFLVSDPAQVLVYGAAPLTVSGAAGLLDDGSGNQTAALVAAPLINHSLVDSDGFTTDQFQRGTGGVTLYVSSTHGNDGHGLGQAQNPGTPLRSLQKAFDLLRDAGQHRRGAAIRLLRGDIFTGDAKMTVSGQDRDHPFVLEDYWHDYGNGRVDPHTRPILRSNMKLFQNDGLVAENQFADGGSMDHVVIRQIQFDMIGRSNSDTAGTGIKAWASGTNWTVDDCLVHNFKNGIGIVDPGNDRIQDFTVLRTIVTDSHFNGVGSEINNAHTQGLFTSKTDGLLISQSTFDRNGRTTSTLNGRNIYSHNIYIQTDCGPATVWGNVIRAGGSHGVQMRSGGILAYNYMARNALNAFISYPGGAATHNVVEKAEDINTQGRGYGLSLLGNNTNTMAAGVLEFNIIVNELGKQPRSIETRQGEAGILNALVRNNTLVNAGYSYHESLLNPNAGHSLRSEWNLTVSADERAVYASPSSGDSDWYDADHNALYANDPSRTFAYVKGVGLDWSAWQQQTGSELSSIRVNPILVNRSASIDKYLKNSTETIIVNQFRQRRPEAWTSTFDAMAIYGYFASQYRPTNFGDSVEDPISHYGAVDYRLAPPRLAEKGDDGLSNSDNVTTITRNLKFLIGDTAEGTIVELWRNNIKVASKPGGSTLTELIDPGPVPDGTHSYTVRQANGNGDRISSPPTEVIIGSSSDNPTPPTEPPPQSDTPTPPDLAEQSDTGATNTDNITKIKANLTFRIGDTPDSATIELWRDDVKVAAKPVGSALGTLNDPGPIPEGAHDYTIRQINPDGSSVRSGFTRVIVDTTRTDAPPPPVLNSSSGSGNISTSSSPEFRLTTPEPDSVIGLLRRPTGTNGSFRWVALRTGSGPIADPDQLNVGSYEYAAMVMDVAGNYSPQSLSSIVTIDSTSDTSTPPPSGAPTPPDLAEQSDTGATSTDNITKIKSGLGFRIGNTPEGSVVELWRGDVKVASKPGGSALGTLNDPGPIPEGAHDYTIRQINPDGSSVRSDPTRVIVDTTRTDAPPPPVLNSPTATRSPEFRLTTPEPDSVIGLLRRPAGTNGSFRWVALRTGSGPIADPDQLNNGSYEYATIVMDVAGNYSPRSLSLIITI